MSPPLPNADTDRDGQPQAIAPSMWVGFLFSALLGNVLPGIGTLYKVQTLRFHDRARVGDELTATVRVTDKRPKRVVMLETRVSNQSGALIADGRAEVIAPDKKIELEAHELPNLLLKSHQHFDRLLDIAADLDPLSTAVVCPEEEMKGYLHTDELLRHVVKSNGGPRTSRRVSHSKMAERGQIRGGLVDGPLAMDNAIDIEAARTKGVTSSWAHRCQ
jgi:hypothetical protein